ncbi:SCO family protein [Halopseudomonas nanhaiensis]|uniref:SCO family protein n=1 Tax=Halopseudomonas nanhaiensis TaxID=2830842 RepID=UPI001CC1574F|nr:SCO family protein [Halopseudomonas nanhaiensis]UAW98490.1 SCO family protein [Halopseudomonas nanhaiensis]
MSGVQRTVWIILAIIAMILGLLLFKMTRTPDLDAEQLSQAGIFVFDAPRPVPEVRLQAAGNGDWTEQQLRGQWDLVFFGYTFCPDICPTTLADLRQLVADLPEQARDNLRVTLVSVDPERDTPARLREYLDYFNPEFRGATGEPAELEKLASALSIAYIEPDTSEQDYLVDHSGQVVLIDPEGRYAGFLRAPLQRQSVTRYLPQLMQR